MAFQNQDTLYYFELLIDNPERFYTTVKNYINIVNLKKYFLYLPLLITKVLFF